MIYPHINYSVVLAHLPKNDEDYKNFNYLEIMFPDILTKTPFRYAIDKRNRWMINKSDCVVTYVRTIIGGAAKYKKRIKEL